MLDARARETIANIISKPSTAQIFIPSPSIKPKKKSNQLGAGDYSVGTVPTFKVEMAISQTIRYIDHVTFSIHFCNNIKYKNTVNI